MTLLTEDMILRRTKTSRLQDVEELNFWGCNIHDISVLRNFTNLKVLGLSVNNIDCLEPLRELQHLEALYLRKNQITDIRQLIHLQRIPQLNVLWVSENPFCETLGNNYRLEVLRLLPNLQFLDAVQFTGAEIYVGYVSIYKEIENLEQETNVELERMSSEGIETELSEETFRGQENVVQDSSHSSTGSRRHTYFPLLRSIFTKCNVPICRSNMRHVQNHTHIMRNIPAGYGYEGLDNTPNRHPTFWDLEETQRTNILSAGLNLIEVLDPDSLTVLAENIRSLLEELS